VYAGARKESDLQALDAIKNVQAIRLDVTKVEEIDTAVRAVTKAGRGLYGLVNNAGVATTGSIIETKPEEFDVVMAVNVYGPYRVTRAFAPLIIANKGRIINIGSISGVLSEPELGVYEMSKHAIESFTDVLAREMAPLGVLVSGVEPGSYNYEIGNSAFKRSGRGAEYADRSKLKDPDEVAAATERALFEVRPKRRYMVVPSVDQAEVTIKAQIEQLVQLNEGQAYTYNRKTLHRMLDDSLASSRPRSK
jgi:NAD(P)-dependent dehydrogenase (short-subunit alcohol dehydrogenase family)